MRKRFFVPVTIALLSVLGVMIAPAASADTSRPGECAPAGAAPEGVVPPSPFLKLPFSEHDSKHGLVVTQGWVTSQDEEQWVGGPGLHRALDFEFVNRPDKGFGVPVFAMADGWAHFSFQHITGEAVIDGVQRKVGWGAGLFTQVIHDNGWVSQYVHLDAVAPGIPYIRPTPQPNSDDWSPDGILKPNEELIPISVRVRQGQFLGWNGDTGVTLDYLDRFDPNTGIVAPRDRIRFPNWEGGNAQLHVALYQGRNQAGNRQNIIDPLGVYGQITETADPYTIRPGSFCSGPSNVFITRHGKFVYARK